MLIKQKKRRAIPWFCQKTTSLDVMLVPEKDRVMSPDNVPDKPCVREVAIIIH